MPKISQNDLELRLIGACLHSPDRFDEVQQIVVAEDLLTSPAQRVFAGLAELRRQGARRWNMNDIVPFVQQADVQWIADAMAEAPINTRAVADQIKDLSVRRGAEEAMRSASTSLRDEKAATLEVLGELAGKVVDLQRRRSDLAPTPMHEIAAKVLRTAAAAKTGKQPVVRLGPAFGEITQAIGGLLPGRYYILAARPSVGKTATALYWAMKGASKPLVITSEMTEEDLVRRMMSMLSGISQTDIDMGRLDAEDWMALEEAARELDRMKITILSAQNRTVHEVTNAAANLHRHHRFDLIVHDYLQLYRPPHARASEYETVSEASAVTKAAAMRLEVPWMQLAQLNRESEKRNDPEPGLPDLRGSGRIEQDADGIFFLHRPWDYRDRGRAPMSDDPEALMVKVAKNRNGPKGKWFVRTDFRTYRFQPYSPVRAV